MEEEATAEERIQLELPECEEEYSQFIDSVLSNHTAVRGVKTVINKLEAYMKAKQQAEKHRDRVRKSLGIINGIRTPDQKRGDSTRSLHNTAKKFYELQNDTSLKAYCNVFNVTYDAYNREHMIEQLVEATSAAQEVETV